MGPKWENRLKMQMPPHRPNSIQISPRVAVALRRRPPSSSSSPFPGAAFVKRRGINEPQRQRRFVSHGYCSNNKSNSNNKSIYNCYCEYAAYLVRTLARVKYFHMTLNLFAGLGLDPHTRPPSDCPPRPSTPF